MAQDLFLGIIESVESGVMSPEEAVTELANLKQEYDFKSDYTLADFQRVRENFLSDLLDLDDDYFEENEFEFDEDEEDDE